MKKKVSYRNRENVKITKKLRLDTFLQFLSMPPKVYSYMPSNRMRSTNKPCISNINRDGKLRSCLLSCIEYLNPFNDNFGVHVHIKEKL